MVVEVRQGGVTGKVKTWLGDGGRVCQVFGSKVQEETWISQGPE